MSMLITLFSYCKEIKPDTKNQRDLLQIDSYARDIQHYNDNSYMNISSTFLGTTILEIKKLLDKNQKSLLDKQEKHMLFFLKDLDILLSKLSEMSYSECLKSVNEFFEKYYVSHNIYQYNEENKKEVEYLFEFGESKSPLTIPAQIEIFGMKNLSESEKFEFCLHNSLIDKNVMEDYIAKILKNLYFLLKGSVFEPILHKINTTEVLSNAVILWTVKYRQNYNNYINSGNKNNLEFQNWIYKQFIYVESVIEAIFFSLQDKCDSTLNYLNVQYIGLQNFVNNFIFLNTENTDRPTLFKRYKDFLFIISICEIFETKINNFYQHTLVPGANNFFCKEKNELLDLKNIGELFNLKKLRCILLPIFDINTTNPEVKELINKYNNIISNADFDTLLMFLKSIRISILHHFFSFNTIIQADFNCKVNSDFKYFTQMDNLCNFFLNFKDHENSCVYGENILMPNVKFNINKKFWLENRDVFIFQLLESIINPNTDYKELDDKFDLFQNFGKFIENFRENKDQLIENIYLKILQDLIVAIENKDQQLLCKTIIKSLDANLEFTLKAIEKSKFLEFTKN